jgi:predicted ATPase/class 3 adenylate cyclase
LFTEIADGAALWDRAPEAMRDALQAHDGVVRRAVDAAGGRVFKRVGGAFFAVFARSDEAVTAALRAQCELATIDFTAIGGLRVRMALHTGACDERDGDFFGPPLNRTARLLAIAHGGQILVSGVTFELARGAFPAEARVLDLGSHRLKNLERAEHVYQIDAPGLPADFPALRSEDHRSENLPRSLASFVGRERDVERVRELIRQARLVTICGLGGVGKTRLAIEASRALHDEFADGTWLVELAPVMEPGLVSARVGAVFGMREQLGTPASDAWITELHDKSALIILDNCEHVLDAAATVVSKLLLACPGLHVLATSREPLHVGGEHLLRLAPLAVPAADPQLPSIEELRQSPAVQLLLERAERTASFVDGSLGDERARVALVTICRRLDGIPLALELAAARVRTLGLPELARRLDDRFRLLAGGDRTALPRQQTLRAALDWSFDLLDDTERRVLERLAIFAGTFVLEAAQDVVADAAIDAWEVMDTLSSLFDKSLITADLSDAVPRYSMLETPRAYARERLARSGERAQVARRHLRYYQARFERFLRGGSAEDDATPAQLEADLDNARAALDWAFGEGAEPVLGAAFARSMHFVFEALSLYHEGLACVERALTALRPNIDRNLEAGLLHAAAKFQSYIGSPSGSLDAAERAAAIYRELAKPKLLASALGFAAFASYYLDRREAGLRVAEEAIAIARPLGDPMLLGWVLCVVAVCTDPAEADRRRALLNEALACCRSLPAGYIREIVHQFLSEVEFQAGDYARSRRYALQGAAGAAGHGPSEGLAMWCLTGAAAAAFALGDVDAAYHNARDALSYGRRRGSGRFIGAALQLLAGVAAQRGDATIAARLLGASDAQFAALGRLRMPQERYVYERTHELLHARLSDTERTAALDAGRGLAAEDAVAEAMRL